MDPYYSYVQLTPRPVVAGMLRLLLASAAAKCVGLPPDLGQKVWRLLPLDMYLVAYYVGHIKYMKDRSKLSAAFDAIREMLRVQQAAEDNDEEDPYADVLEASPYRTSETIWELYHLLSRHKYPADDSGDSQSSWETNPNEETSSIWATLPF